MRFNYLRLQLKLRTQLAEELQAMEKRTANLQQRA